MGLDKVDNRWTYREAYKNGCITKIRLVYPLIEDDVSEVPLVDIHFKSMAKVKKINKKLLIHFLLSEDIRRIEENSCDRNQATHR